MAKLCALVERLSIFALKGASLNYRQSVELILAQFTEFTVYSLLIWPSVFFTLA